MRMRTNPRISRVLPNRRAAVGSRRGSAHNIKSGFSAAGYGQRPSKAARMAGLSVTAPPHGTRPRLLRSFFAAGFECSTFIRRSGRRLDLVAETRHEAFAEADYLRLQREGLRVAREGIRWHVVAPSPGHFDFASLVPIVRGARATGTQVIWDLCHFGWPDYLDLFQPQFVSALAEYGAAAAQWLATELEGPLFFVPVNEISYFAWASGDEGSMHPFATGRGFELKQQLVRAAMAAMDAIRAVAPNTRFAQVDPLIHVVPSPRHPEEAPAAAAYRESQFQAWDLLGGRLCPELGGNERYLDIIGVNFYPHNQWFYNLQGHRRVRKFTPLRREHPLYRPFREMLREVYQRYDRPLFVAETGAENRRRAGWFRYVCEEVQAALRAGIPVQGMCLYPILNHPGWVDDRHCHNALWDYPDNNGHRKIYLPLARELRRWRAVLDPQPPNGEGSLSGSVDSPRSPLRSRPANVPHRP